MSRQLWGIAIILFASLTANTSADFLVPTGLDGCQDCCFQAKDDFPSYSFDRSACLLQGCFRWNYSNQLCNQLFTDPVSDGRKGCELGRDFRFNGFTSLLTSSSDLLQCEESNGRGSLVSFSLPGDVPANLNFSIFLQTDSLVEPNIETSACQKCCTDLNANFDNGDSTAGLADDFAVASCKSSCSTELSCFDESSHRERTGCLVALDLLFQGQASLIRGDSAFSCNALGQSGKIDATNFPTFSPATTVSPSASPTEANKANGFQILLQQKPWIIYALSFGLAGVAMTLGCVTFWCVTSKPTQRPASAKELRALKAEVLAVIADGKENRPRSIAEYTMTPAVRRGRNTLPHAYGHQSEDGFIGLASDRLSVGTAAVFLPSGSIDLEAVDRVSTAPKAAGRTTWASKANTSQVILPSPASSLAPFPSSPSMVSQARPFSANSVLIPRSPIISKKNVPPLPAPRNSNNKKDGSAESLSKQISF